MSTNEDEDDLNLYFPISASSSKTSNESNESLSIFSNFVLKLIK